MLLPIVLSVARAPSIQRLPYLFLATRTPMDRLAHQTCPVSTPCEACSRCGSAMEPRCCCLEHDVYSLLPHCARLLLQVQQPSRALKNEGWRPLSHRYHHSRLPSTKVGRRKAGCDETALLATRWSLCNRCHLPSMHRVQ